MASTAARTSSPSKGDALLVCAAVLAFLPVLRAGFLGWDDPIMALDPRLTLDAAGLRWMLTSLHTGLYQPATWLSMAVDRALWGERAFGFHLTSLLLHGLNAVLFHHLCRRLLRDPRAALLAALLFAVHPLGAESVAWVSERKGLLSTAFALLTALLHLEGRRGLSAACFAAALASKATAVGLPVALLFLGGRLRDLWPHLALSAAAGLLGAQAAIGAPSRGLADRLTLFGYGLAFYPRKLLWPAGLGPLYEAPVPAAALWPAAVLSAAACAAAAWAAARREGARQALACYGALVFPTLGLVSHGRQLAADRYGYLACLPLFALAGAGLARLPRLAVAAVLAGLVALSTRQSGFWRDDLSLWSRAVAVWPESAVAQSNLAVALSRAGADAGAVERARAAVRVDPGYAPARDAFGAALLRLGHPDEAAEQLRAAARLDWKPSRDARLARAEFNRGNRLLKAKRLRPARWRFETAARLDPSFEPARRNRALAIAAAARPSTR